VWAFALLLCVNGFAAVKSGEKAVAFTLPELYTPEISRTMEDFKGQIVLLNIWASWCSGCKAEMPEFFHLQQAFAGKKFRIVTVSIDGDREKSIRFLEGVEQKVGMKTPFTALWNEEKSLAEAYGVRGMPTSYLIDKEGKVIRAIVGSFSKKSIAALEAEIHTLLGE
jgi:thiol-disulfide isomerase/thioredoxin